MRVLDAHVHVWDPATIDYPWLAEASHLRGAHLPADIDAGERQVTEWIFVEADAVAGAGPTEARWVDGLDWPGLVGIVAQIDFRRRTPAQDLEELAAVPRLRGVRHLLQGEPVGEPWFEGLAEGIDAVTARGLTFDACVRWPQLAALADLLTPRREARVVLDHLGKPPVDDGLHSESGKSWLSAMQRLALLPGLTVKLSGLAAEASTVDALDAHAPAFLRAGLDLFGADRCMFATDWPVSAKGTGGVTTARWLDMVAAASEGHDVDAIMRGTAVRAYGLAAQSTSGDAL